LRKALNLGRGGKFYKVNVSVCKRKRLGPLGQGEKRGIKVKGKWVWVLKRLYGEKKRAGPLFVTEKKREGTQVNGSEMLNRRKKKVKKRGGRGETVDRGGGMKVSVGLGKGWGKLWGVETKGGWKKIQLRTQSVQGIKENP